MKLISDSNLKILLIVFVVTETVIVLFNAKLISAVVLAMLLCCIFSIHSIIKYFRRDLYYSSSLINLSAPPNERENRFWLFFVDFTFSGVIVPIGIILHVIGINPFKNFTAWF
ncbi:hypothetical protein GCM10009007_20960 [Formosimonas limnophila]|uniref:Uncharacterized protein n=1 Tax=Formosimonas limnophila TaxID=1384487 RepID=A0A8J3CP77_9BURK|nr:hypothetical protein [Formosimonas limnophila]GHA79860.1 hypothetical protein GCM10009007_20960 [Formosimonas limnophila]